MKHSEPTRRGSGLSLTDVLLLSNPLEFICEDHMRGRQGSLSPGQAYPTTSVTGMSSAVTPFRTAPLTWNSAT
jgi:hypothetical protein